MGWAKSGGLGVKPPDADEILADKIAMHADFASKSVHIGKKNVNTNYSLKVNTSLCIITQQYMPSKMLVGRGAEPPRS